MSFAEGTGEGLGAVTWWGFSPAKDLQKEADRVLEAELTDNGRPSELSILMVGAGDGRHLLSTICQSQRWPKRKLAFYIVENNLEVLARHMLFLVLTLESPKRMGLQEKTEIFLELFGNTLIRSSTVSYLSDTANFLIRAVTDPEWLRLMLPCINITALKFKEKDQLEAIFKFWKNRDRRVFPIDKFWDGRLRRYLGVRYDSRIGAYDWDLMMKLHDRGAKLIGSREYTRWRDKGIAFEPREGIFEEANKTLASGILLMHNGERRPVRGYWGDIVTSPFVSFGIETEEENLKKTRNGVHVNTARDISYHNLLALFHELLTGKKYSHVQAQPDSGSIATSNDSGPLSTGDSIVLSTGKDFPQQETPNTDSIVSSSSSSTEAYFDFLSPGAVTIHFLNLDSVSQFHLKSKYTDLFNVLYFSNSMVHHLTPNVRRVCAKKAVLFVETTKFLLDVRAETSLLFAKRVEELTTAAGFHRVGAAAWEKESLMEFIAIR
uniref:dynein axonemal assembly factor 3 isoform X2 n=1 Tax=Myxine glutinosa TaxID=7769 RepID=UPI00358F975C